MSSPFLDRPASDWIAENPLAFAIFDGYPVSPGHALIIPRRLVATWFEATAEEQRALMELVEVVKRRLDETHRPNGYNIGINVGDAAGQTVFHLHVHLIPRYRGDMDDPRGGVRHVIPWRGNYKKKVERLATGRDDPFKAHLLPLFESAHTIAIVSAFVQESGLFELGGHLLAARERGASVRFLTGDYLGITAPEALWRLLGWVGKGFEARVFETGGHVVFHPKSWRIDSPVRGVAFVGSSNVSVSALEHGIEWNLRLERDDDRVAYERLVKAFESLWREAVPLSAEWIEGYELRATTRADPALGEREPPFSPPTPHAVQGEALAQLARARAQERGRALVVLATGLGKTWLAAFDLIAAFGERTSPPRVLFIAHREEILSQAAHTLGGMLRHRWPEASIDFCAGPSDALHTDLVLASIQKVARAPWLDRLAEIRWDYVIVDEAHHGVAASYRKVLDRLDAGFVLGLTATPERQDEADLLGLFDDHLAYRADLDRGIAEALLVPFAYFGIRDTTDFANIPWRNRRFDPELLSRAVETEARMERMWQAWEARPGTRTLIFCCSISHAQYVTHWLRDRGVRIEAVHSGEDSADRAEALTRLRDGELDAVVTVDMFNEGVDLPQIDRVVMLRPTESPVVFLQQLGRGLRRAPGKERVTVLDFVGNHRVFVERIGRLLSLGARSPIDAVRTFVDGAAPDLPPGCSVELELEAIDLLKRLLPTGRNELERAYRELRSLREKPSSHEESKPGDARPTLGELFRLGVSPQALRASGGWFDFVKREGDLEDAEVAVLEACGEWLRELETSAMSKCFKAIVIEALIESDAFESGLSLSILAEKCHRLLVRSPELMQDLVGVAALTPVGQPRSARPSAGLEDPRHPDPAAWRRFWRTNPIAAWTGGRFFELENREGEEHLVPTFGAPPGLESVLVEMTRELIDYRLAQYRRRLVARAERPAEPHTFDATLGWSGHDPVLRWLGAHPEPGTLTARVEGVVWDFTITRTGCSQASRATLGPRRNQLPDLLRRWFGPRSGQEGAAPDARVRFVRSPDAWWVEALGVDEREAEVVDLASRRVRAYPTLKAAAGAVGEADEATDLAAEERLVERDAPWVGQPDVFLVAVSGDSMDGGARPIRDGDWVALRWARGVGVGALEGRVALVQVPDPVSGFAWQLKRVVREDLGWRLRSDNPERPSFMANADTVAIATLVDVLGPEEVRNPSLGVRPRRPSRPLPEPALARAREVADAIVDAIAGRELEAGEGRKVRVLGRVPRGGVRIDGGPGGFRERTVSLVDLGWVLVAQDEAERLGVPLDEALVNRFRYHPGTQRSQTRWIDTGWAICLIRLLRSPPA